MSFIDAWIKACNITEQNITVFTEIICMKDAYAQYAKIVEKEKM